MPAILEYLITVVVEVLECTALLISMRHLRSRAAAVAPDRAHPESVEVLRVVQVLKSSIGKPTVVLGGHSLQQVLEDLEIEAAVLPAVEGTVERVPETAPHMPVERVMEMAVREDLRAVTELKAAEVADIGEAEAEALPLLVLLVVGVAATPVV